LPLTGGLARSLFAYAGMLIAAGAVLLTTGRRIGTAG
jgi:LPXTG-motif cell wall-anchored protein